MENIHILSKSSEKPPLPSFLILFGVFLISMVIGNLIGTAFMISIADLSWSEIATLSSTIIENPNGWWALIVNQGISSLFTFIISGIFYWKYIEKKKFDDLSWNSFPSLPVMALLLLSQLFFAPLNGWVQGVNESLELPTYFSGIENFIKSMEKELSELTQYLTSFTTPMQLIVALVVIAGVAGVGEELIFRGLLQRKLFIALKNEHLAIWLAAFIFSAIHFQFYGFLPRLLLGAMFGYFYFWTGNIWVPIVGHVFNNGLAVLMIHLVNKKMISSEMEKMENTPLQYLIGASILFIGSLYILKMQLKKKTAI
jgi:uncharacterized protein